MSWLIVVIALVGIVLNVQRKWQGFLFWLVSNAWWFQHNLVIGEYAQAVLFFVFWILSVYGIYCWKRKESNYGGQKNSIKNNY